MATQSSTDYTPIAPGVVIRLRNRLTNKVVDYNTSESGSPVRLWTASANNRCQRFTLVKAEGDGYYIKHLDSGNYLALDNTRIDAGSGMAWVVGRVLGSGFIFRQSDGGSVLILLADRTRYSMNDFTGNPSDGTPIVLWPNNKDEKDQWFLEQDSS